MLYTNVRAYIKERRDLRNWYHESPTVIHIEGEIEVLEVIKELDKRIEVIANDEDIKKRSTLGGLWEVKQAPAKMYHTIQAKVSLSMTCPAHREVLKQLRTVLYGKENCKKFP